MQGQVVDAYVGVFVRHTAPLTIPHTPRIHQATLPHWQVHLTATCHPHDALLGSVVCVHGAPDDIYSKEMGIPAGKCGLGIYKLKSLISIASMGSSR